MSSGCEVSSANQRAMSSCSRSPCSPLAGNIPVFMLVCERSSRYSGYCACIQARSCAEFWASRMLTVTAHLRGRLRLPRYRAESPARYPEIDDRSSIVGRLLSDPVISLLLLLRLGRRLLGRGCTISRRSLSGIASGGSGITRSLLSVTSRFLSLDERFLSLCSRILRGLSGLFLRARDQRQRQRDSGENHFCVHENDHPDVTDEGGQLPGANSRVFAQRFEPGNSSVSCTVCTRRH